VDKETWETREPPRQLGTTRRDGTTVSKWHKHREQTRLTRSNS